jgi:beta-lactamase class A
MYISELRRKKKNNNRKYIFAIIIILLLYLIVRPHTNTPGGIISPIPGISGTLTPTDKANATIQSSNLEKNIKDRIGSSIINYSVFVKPIGGNPLVDINSSIVFPAASVNKLPILASLYSLVESGEINLDTDITIQPTDVQDYGTGSIRYDSPGTVYSIKTLAQLMAQKSDNTAEYVLFNDIIGSERAQSLIDSWGLTQTNLVQNQTSNIDISRLMEKVYKGEIANTARTKELLGFIYKTDYEDRLPAKLPTEVKVYHKIGNGIRVLHDVGIVEYPKGAYYIGFLTNDINSDEETTQIIAEVSKIVYENISSKK